MCLSVAAIPSAGDVLEAETSPMDNLLNADSNTTEYSDEDHNYLINMKMIHDYLDTIEHITRPGCSSEVLNMALESMSQIVVNLSLASSSVEHHTSL
ncbi:unnamed protein product [Rhodiola kirilowii]